MKNKLKKAALGGPDPEIPYNPIPGLWNNLPYIVNGQFQTQQMNEIANGKLVYDREANMPPPVDNIPQTAGTSQGVYSPFSNSLQPGQTVPPLNKQESKYQFGINYDHIFGSQIIQGVGTALANNSQNSQGNAVKRFNAQYNNLPYTPNNSLQALYGMEKGGMVGTPQFEDGGDTMSQDEILKWIGIFPDEQTQQTDEPNQERADKVVNDFIEGSDEDKFNEIWSNFKEKQSYYQRMKSSNKFDEGGTYEVSDEQYAQLVKQGYKIQKLK